MIVLCTAAALGGAVTLLQAHILSAEPLAASAPQDPPQDPQGDDGKPLGPGPQWRGPVRPTAANEVFATGNGCAMCHSVADTAFAMRSATGDDVSPHGLWQATVMANSFRDPYWRASVAKEVAAQPAKARELETLCMRCHAPMALHSATLAGMPVPTIAEAAQDPLAQDGVSCTVCHKIEAKNLGTKASWSGGGTIGRDRAIYGPFADPAVEPMQNHAGYTPQLGAHVQTSAHCATCHTLLTHHVPGATEFPEQTPYLEWRNSEFSDEHGRTATSRTCQECHMADMGELKIARNPPGRDFLIPPRPFRAHAFVGGNAFLLDLLDKHRDELGVTAPSAALQRMAIATRAQLNARTGIVTVSPLARGEGRLRFAVTIENRTGHKFPTGYPARRAFLHVQVRAGSELVFECGTPDRNGTLKGIADELAIPHRQRVESKDDVVVYELVAADAAGKPTTTLSAMATRLKDNRILPKGWRQGGPHAEATGPAGIGDDPDFVGGSDTVHFDVPLPDATPPGLRVLVWLHYQTIPPAWVADLRALEAPEAKAFVRMYDAADKVPETITIGQRFER